MPTARPRTIQSVMPPSTTERAFRTVSGRSIDELYTEDSIAGLNYDRDLADPGQFPYTRGIHPIGYRGKLWTMRQFAGFAAKEP